MKKKYIKTSKNFFKNFNFKIEFDWDSYYRMQELEILKEEIENFKKAGKLSPKYPLDK